MRSTLQRMSGGRPRCFSMQSVIRRSDCGRSSCPNLWLVTGSGRPAALALRIIACDAGAAFACFGVAPVCIGCAHHVGRSGKLCHPDRADHDPGDGGLSTLLTASELVVPSPSAFAPRKTVLNNTIVKVPTSKLGIVSTDFSLTLDRRFFA